MRSYSQFGEDIIIQRYFPKDYIGTCIEVGAADGIMGSNTLMFEKKGWKVICVEPNPILATECSKNRETLWECAIGEKVGYADLTIFHIPGSNQSAVSSIKVDERLREQHKQLIQKTEIVKVKVETLDNIIDWSHLTNIDFLSIDTEGTELQVLRGFNIEKWKPKLLVIENNFNDPEIENYVTVFGYRKVLRNIVNDFYTW